MKKLLLFLLVLPLLAWAQNPIDGTWKMDLSSVQLPPEPQIFVLQDGVFHCKTCAPSFDIKADGQWQKAAGHKDFDAMMVKVVNEKQIVRAIQKDGKETMTSKATASDDGKIMTVDWVDKSSPTGKETTGTTTFTRIAAGPTGSHACSGSWQREKVEQPEQDILVATYKSTLGGMDYSSSAGESYSAKFDGVEVPVKGVPGNTLVSIRKLGVNGLEETYKREGKVVGVSTMTVDANKMFVEYVDKEQESTMKMSFARQ